MNDNERLKPTETLHFFIAIRRKKENRDKQELVFRQIIRNEPEYYKGKVDGDKLDDFAYSEGYHNGYKCKVCGFEFCEHCYDECDIQVCKHKKTNVTMKDDGKLSAWARGK